MWGPLWCQWLESLGAYMPIDFVLVLNNIVGPRDLLLPPAMLGAAPGNSVVLQILVGREGLSLSLPALVSCLAQGQCICFLPAICLPPMPLASLHPGCPL